MKILLFFLFFCNHCFRFFVTFSSPTSSVPSIIMSKEYKHFGQLIFRFFGASASVSIKFSINLKNEKKNLCLTC